MTDDNEREHDRRRSVLVQPGCSSLRMTAGSRSSEMATLLKVSAPIQDLQQMALGAAEAHGRVQASRRTGDGSVQSALEQLGDALEYFDQHESAAQLEAAVRHLLRPSLAPLIESLVNVTEGSRLARLPDSVVRRVERDAVHPHVVLLIASIRQELLAAKAVLGGESGPIDTPPTDQGSEAKAAS